MSPALFLLALFVSLCLLFIALAAGSAVGWLLSAWQQRVNARQDGFNRALIGYEARLIDVEAREERQDAGGCPGEPQPDEADWWKNGPGESE